MSNNTTFCDLQEFAKSYKDIHGYLSLFVCVFGSVANILNICVLTSKEMRWPTNLILTGLAVSDLLVMLEYIPFAFHRYINDTKNISQYTYNWALFMIFHALFTQIFHFISCSLTVILAIWRYITITNPKISRVWCSMRRTLYVILSTYVVCPIICCPFFFSLEIKRHNQTCDLNGRMIDQKDLHLYSNSDIVKRVLYYTDYSDSDIINIKNVSFVIYGVVTKLVPCILLVYLSWRLISVLLDTKKRRQLLLNSSFPMENVSSVKPILSKRPAKDKQAGRTSTMLLAVLFLFLITEFPQAILGLLSVIFGKDFEKQCYIPLGDVMDILALTNSAINFILYCTMSRQFRSTFNEFFKIRIFRKWIPLTQHSSTEKTQLSQV